MPMATSSNLGPKVGVLCISSSRFAELDSPTRHLSVLDPKPEQKRPAKEVIAEHVSDLRRRSEQLAQRASAIESELAVAT